MAATPEEFLGQGDFLAVPEPFSPSVFLDLPPTPRPDGGEDPASSDDLVLPFISRMLMEEDIDDKFFYQYPDHPALLTAQQPYAQILSAPSSSSSDSATATTTNTTLSPSCSSDAAEPTWPYDPIELVQLLRSPPSPELGMGLHDFTADDATAGFLPAQDAAAAGQRSMVGEAIQSSGSRGGAEQEDTKTNITTFPAVDEDHGALASAFFGGHQGVNMDMLNEAFAKGMEEAKKFLPANNGLLIDLEATTGEEHLPTDSKPFTVCQVKKEEEVVVDGTSMFRGSSNGRGRKNRHHEDDLEAEIGRSSKLMMPEEEDTDAQEMYRELMTFNVEGFMKRLQDLRIAKDVESAKGSRKGARGRQGANEVVDLRTMLIHCAQAVATGDLRSANETLKQIKQHSSLTGDATQRLAYCFAEGLEARIAGTGSLVYQSLVSKRTSVVDYLKAYRLFMAATCFKKVKHIFSNKTIADAVTGKSKLHIIDYGIQHGFQWPGLLHFLANREGGPPEVRFTGIDLPQPGFRPAYQIEKTGERLSICAHQFRVPFKFQGIAAKWETVTPEDLNIDPDEVLVVSCECFLDKLMDESVVVDSPSPRDMVLNNIRNMRPNVFIHCVVNGTLAAPFFLTRFREALFFFSAQFDMLDATIPRDNDVRMLIERDIMGRSALNVIACEGADRVERPETYKQWQVRNYRAGLRQLPLRAEVVKLVRDKIADHYHKDFLLDEDHRWLLQGWKGRVLYAISTWVAADSNSIF
ncbi:hypothetical protein PR202_ga22798 [Eleusine coracana subsp. coracana]|uniref:Scarecrow-like protein 9 n=1 Tax=Eleusine coracana subsp. coracana TaxID=191504 RepID=A0AAV5D2M6_ELECO|nr:hypothetical protein PR202_ga22798 [Eleusine coracana subsp. coracana]